MRGKWLGMRGEVIKNAENAIEKSVRECARAAKSVQKAYFAKIFTFLPFTLDIILDYSIFGPVNERRQQNKTRM